MNRATVELEGHWWAIVPCRRKDMDSPHRDGECDYENNIIQIYNRLPLHKQIEITLHEAMHAQQPDMDEERVARRAKELTRALIKTGILKQSKRSE